MNVTRGVSCPTCGCVLGRVVWTRKQVNHIRRRKECEHCGKRYLTSERIVTDMEQSDEKSPNEVDTDLDEDDDTLL